MKKDASRELKKDRNKKIVKTIILLLLGFLILIFATIAWFAMNNNTTASGMSVSAKDTDYELAVKGDNIGAISYSGDGEDSTTYFATPINDFPTAVNAADGSSGIYTTTEGVTGIFYTTSGNYDEIKWMVQNGWLKIELNMSKTEKFIELERMLSDEKEKLETAAVSDIKEEK